MINSRIVYILCTLFAVVHADPVVASDLWLSAKLSGCVKSFPAYPVLQDSPKLFFQDKMKVGGVLTISNRGTNLIELIKAQSKLDDYVYFELKRQKEPKTSDSPSEPWSRLQSDAYSVTLQFASNQLSLHPGEIWQIPFVIMGAGVDPLSEGTYSFKIGLKLTELLKDNVSKSPTVESQAEVFSSRRLETEEDQLIYEEYMGKQMFAEKRYAEAVEHFQGILKLRPEDDFTLVSLGDSYAFLHDYDRAARYYQDVVNIWKKKGFVRMTGYERMHTKDDLIPYFEKRIKTIRTLGSPGGGGSP